MSSKEKFSLVLAIKPCAVLCSVPSAVFDSLWPVDCSPPGSFVRGILQAGILELVAISFSLGPWVTESCSVMSDSLGPYELYSPWNSPSQNTGAGSLSLLQGIFPTQESNPGLSHCRQILYQLSHKGSPRILERVAYPFSSGSFRPRNRTGVSCTTDVFFANWAVREAPDLVKHGLFS